MRVIVTGGAGFVGTHLTRQLLNLDHQVMVIDNLFTGRTEHLYPGALFEKIDLGAINEDQLFAIVRAFQPSHVVHLAGIHYIPYCMQHPGETFASNVRSTEVMLRAVQCTPVEKFVAASSMDVYQVTDEVHHEEDPTAPCDVYGMSKLVTEHLLEFATRVNANLSAVSLRFSNIYGPNETNPHLIPRVLELIRERTAPELRMGYLGGTRDFVYVTDVVDAIVAALSTPTGKYDVFNVGTGIPTTIRKVIEFVKAVTGDLRPVLEDKALFRSFDRVSLTAAIEKIQAQLGWSAKIPLQEGISRVVVNAPAITRLSTAPRKLSRSIPHPYRSATRHAS